MPEIRFEAKAETVAVLDGYCSATGRCRTAFINGLLEEWARQKMIRTTVEFQALEYPLPDAAREKLEKLGKAACHAREKAGNSAIVTKEGSALAEFEAGLRTTIGVLHRREWLGSRAL